MKSGMMRHDNQKLKSSDIDYKSFPKHTTDARW